MNDTAAKRADDGLIMTAVFREVEPRDEEDIGVSVQLTIERKMSVRESLFVLGVGARGLLEAATRLGKQIGLSDDQVAREIFGGEE